MQDPADGQKQMYKVIKVKQWSSKVWNTCQLFPGLPDLSRLDQRGDAVLADVVLLRQQVDPLDRRHVLGELLVACVDLVLEVTR